MPGLQRLFAAEHRRRTARPDGSRDPILPLERYPGHVGQEDDYVDAYFGRRYDGDSGDPLEVLARATEYTLEKSFGWEWLHELAREDPLMLDLVLGVLFHYDP